MCFVTLPFFGGGGGGLFYENIPNRNTIINSINISIAYSAPEACRKYKYTVTAYI